MGRVNDVFLEGTEGTDNQGGGGSREVGRQGGSRERREEGGRKQGKKRKTRGKSKKRGRERAGNKKKRKGRGKGTENKLENVRFCDFKAGKLSQFGAGRE